MSRPPGRPTTADRENSTDSVDVPQSKRLTRQQKRFQLWKGMAYPKSAKTNTKRRPSMPTLPWDKSDG